MIDIENEVFSNVADKVRAKFTDCSIAGEYVKAPSSFPHVSLVEMDNSVYTSTITSGCGENHATLMYEVNVYSNKKKGKKSECKEIIALVDEIMLGYGFVRTYLNPVPNMDDATIYRILGRYTAIVSKDKIIYRR